MTGFTPVMDFFCFTFYISVTLPLSLLQKFTRLHAKLLLDGCKDKKNEDCLESCLRQQACSRSKRFHRLVPPRAGKLSSKHAGPSF